MELVLERERRRLAGDGLAVGAVESGELDLVDISGTKVRLGACEFFARFSPGVAL
jgi:hypothetical protein